MRLILKLQNCERARRVGINTPSEAIFNFGSKQYLPHIKVRFERLFLRLVPTTDVVTPALIGHQLAMGLDDDGIEVLNTVDLKETKIKIKKQRRAKFSARKRCRLALHVFSFCTKSDQDFLSDLTSNVH